MQITEVRVKLMDDSDDRLQAFCSITFDDSFVVRDLKIIDGTNGPFVAMPSRKLTTHCHDCGSKNHLRANFCNQCGKRQSSDRGAKDHEGRAKLYADIAHPINSECREQIQNRVIDEYQDELERAKDPNYVSRYDDDYDLDVDVDDADSKRSSGGRGERIDDHHNRVDAPRGKSGKAESRTKSTQDADRPAPAAADKDRAADKPANHAAGKETLRGPHQPRSESSVKSNANDAETSPRDSDPGSDDFGAGIFD